MIEPLYRTKNLCGPYEIIRFLRSGGMGDVYVAKHRVSRAIVALKCLRSCHRGDRKMAARMEREAEFLGLIRHRNIVRVMDAGMADDGTLWIALELLEGRTLREILRAMGRLSLLDALYIAVHVAEGMEAVHEYDGIHRDLKPENVMVTAGREVKVLDFGIAKLYSVGDHQSTDRSQILGTPHYMSPEHLNGESVDLRTDVYALGLILYEMLAGRHVFAGGGEPLTSDQVSRMQLHADLSLRAHGSAHIPGYVWPILDRALKKQRDERYASMAEIAQDIHEAGRRARWEGHVSILFDGVSTGDEGEENDPTRDTAPLSSSEVGSPPENAPDAEGQRYWRTWPKGSERPERDSAEENKTMELRRGDPLPPLAPVLPFKPLGEPAANDAVEHAWSGLEVGELGGRREPESEARAVSEPTVRLRAPASKARPRDVEEDIPTKRAGAYLSAVPAPPEAMPALGKLPRHVMLALVLGPLASSALVVGLMQALLYKGAAEARPTAEEERAPAAAEPVRSSAEPPAALPCPAAVDPVRSTTAPISSVAALEPSAPSAPMPPAPAVVPAAKGLPRPAGTPPTPARSPPGKKPGRIF